MADTTATQAKQLQAELQALKRQNFEVDQRWKEMTGPKGKGSGGGGAGFRDSRGRDDRFVSPRERSSGGARTISPRERNFGLARGGPGRMGGGVSASSSSPRESTKRPRDDEAAPSEAKTVLRLRRFLAAIPPAISDKTSAL
eukprot:SAG31_NODE_21578_length_546_cov_0.684564_1_plen_142_part_00